MVETSARRASQAGLSVAGEAGNAVFLKSE
jgi:hypothetical protein